MFEIKKYPIIVTDGRRPRISKDEVIVTVTKFEITNAIIRMGNGVTAAAVKFTISDDFVEEFNLISIINPEELKLDANHSDYDKYKFKITLKGLEILERTEVSTCEEFIKDLKGLTMSDFGEAKDDEEGMFPDTHWATSKRAEEISIHAEEILFLDGFLNVPNERKLKKAGFDVAITDSDSYGIICVVISWQIDGNNVAILVG